jgi:TRAP-type C4-dicarboxylate transport system permease small subunit
MQSPLDTFEYFFLKLTVLFAALVAVSIGLMALLIPLNLIIIKAHIGSMWWLNGAIEYALFFGVFAGAPWVLQQGAHVRVDVLTSSLSKNAALTLDNIINLIGALICIILCFYGTRAGITEFIDQTLPDKDLRIPNWIVVVFFAFSFLMLAIEFLLRFRKTRLLTVGVDKIKAEVGF